MIRRSLLRLFTASSNLAVTSLPKRPLFLMSSDYRLALTSSAQALTKSLASFDRLQYERHDIDRLTEEIINFVTRVNSIDINSSEMAELSKTFIKSANFLEYAGDAETAKWCRESIPCSKLREAALSMAEIYKVSPAI